jgi:hypothetical protein
MPLRRRLQGSSSLAGPKSGNVEIGTLQAEILGTFLYIGFGVEGLLLCDENLLRLWRVKRRFPERLKIVRYRARVTGFFLTLYFVLRELVESLSLLDDGVSVFRIPFTVGLDSGSRPRLC